MRVKSGPFSGCLSSSSMGTSPPSSSSTRSAGTFPRQRSGSIQYPFVLRCTSATASRYTIAGRIAGW
jgi:hypothetical protein